MHYLNQAASGLMHNDVVHAITQQLQREQNQGTYAAVQSVAPELQQLYQSLAELMKCAPEEIALTTGNSQGWCAAVSALPLSAGDRVFITPGEWGGNYAMLRQLQVRTGISLEVVPCTASGAIDLSALDALLDERVKLLALTWLPANGACLYDAEALGALCSRHRIPYVIDAAQVLGHMPVDVQSIRCDALVAPGRKWLCGPRGTGVVYLRQSFIERLDPIFVDHLSCPMTAGGPALRKDARVLENSEGSVALKLGLKAALDLAKTQGWEQRYTHIAQKARQLRSVLSAVPGLRFQGWSAASDTCGIVPFTMDGRRSEEVQQSLMQRGIQVAVCGKGFVPLDMQARGLESVIRASVAWHTQDEDIAALAAALSEL